MWGELASSFQQGNPYVILIFVVGFLATVILIERMIMLQFVFNINFSKFLTNLRKTVGAEDLDRAMALCKSTSRTSLPRIALRALESAETDPTTVRGSIEEETIEFLPRLEARLNILPAFATLVMMIGILGTIDSIWAAFHSIDVLDTAKKQATLAQGIAASLNPAAMGILVCMIVLGGHQLIKGAALRLTERVHHGVAVLSNLLVPAEAAYIPMAAVAAGGAETSASTSASADISDANTAAQGGANDALDDTSVEDIKDEEEII